MVKGKGGRGAVPMSLMSVSGGKTQTQVMATEDTNSKDRTRITVVSSNGNVGIKTN